MNRNRRNAPLTSVAIVSTKVTPSIGGVERYTDAIVEELRRIGVPVSVVTTTPGRREGYVVLNSIPNPDSRIPVPSSPQQVWRALQGCFHHRTPATIIQTRFYPLGLVFALAAFVRRTPAFVIDHSSGHVDVGGGWRQRAADAADHLLTGLLKLLRVEFFAVSKSTERWLAHFGVRSQAILRNAIDDASFRPCSTRIDNRRLKTALFVGRLIRDKGILEAMRAFDQLGGADAGWHLQVVGDGPLASTVAASGADNITFLGALPHDRVIELISEADAVLLPTTYPEGLPTIALEAGAYAVPLVATAAGGLAELLADGENGYLLPSPSVENIVRALKEISSDHEESSRRARRLQRLVTAHYTWSKTLAGVGDLIGLDMAMVSDLSTADRRPSDSPWIAADFHVG